MKKKDLINFLFKACSVSKNKKINGVYIPEFTDNTGKVKVCSLYVDDGQAGVLLENGNFLPINEMSYNELYKIYSKLNKK